MFGCIDYVGLGVCCQSWSRSRRWDGGPPPLRTDIGPELWCRHFQNKPDTLKVQLGNMLLHVSRLLAITCAIFRVPGYIENLQSSRIWLTPIMRDTIFITNGFQKIMHYCMYGTR